MKKLKLENLVVNSFTTSDEKNELKTILGGSWLESCITLKGGHTCVTNPICTYETMNDCHTWIDNCTGPYI